MFVCQFRGLLFLMENLNIILPRVSFVLGVTGFVISCYMLFGTITSGIMLLLISCILISLALKAVSDE